MVGGPGFDPGASGSRTVRTRALCVCAAFGAHARIRNGDLFLIKWSLGPGEFEPILAAATDFGGDHLLGCSSGVASTLFVGADVVILFED